MGWRPARSIPKGSRSARSSSDIETLNRAAVTGTYEVTAVSFHAYAHLSEKYALLPHGASMGDDYGPMVVVRQDGPTTLDGVTVAIPGTWTTRVARAAALSAGAELQGDALRRDPRGGPRRQGRRRPDHPRRPAHLRGRGPAQAGRPRRVVGGADRRAAAAARRQHHPPRPRPRGDAQGVAPAAREHRATRSTIAQDALEYAKQFGRGLDDAKTDRSWGCTSTG